MGMHGQFVFKLLVYCFIEINIICFNCQPNEVVGFTNFIGYLLNKIIQMNLIASPNTDWRSPLNSIPFVLTPCLIVAWCPQACVILLLGIVCVDRQFITTDSLWNCQKKLQTFILPTIVVSFPVLYCLKMLNLTAKCPCSLSWKCRFLSIPRSPFSVRNQWRYSMSQWSFKSYSCLLACRYGKHSNVATKRERRTLRWRHQTIPRQ